MFSFMATAALLSANPSFEYVVDCSSWGGMNTTEIVYRYEARDGTVFRRTLQLLPGSDPQDAACLLGFGAERQGWRIERIDDKRFIIRGFKDSPLRRVTMTSEVWIPTYYRRVAGTTPQAVAPPPRPVVQR